MKKTLFILILAILNSLPAFPQKKVYADYHGIRRTRNHDGDFGEWKYFSTLASNSTGVTQLTYNPDLVSPDGRHNLAAANYPAVGMQSQYDPLYLEYQILSAKTAGIDGFFVEWGYTGHSSNVLLQKITDIAAKYNFEIGVNLCDGWLMNKNWYQGSREEKVQYFVSCMQYLIDNVFTGPTAPLVKGRPVLYLFHDGFTAEEFNLIRTYPYTYPAGYPVKEGDKFPQVFMRTMLNPTLENGVYTPKSPMTQAGSYWVQTNKVVPAPWIPERIRDAAPVFPRFNKYATSDDCITFLQAFADHVWRMGMPLNTGLVSPGMDNYGCGGWSPTGKLYYIPRANGETYSQMWEFNLLHAGFLDMVYIASWNDYTEGHEIEPTNENGDHDLKTTLKYASRFKGVSADETGIKLPYELFLLRKQQEFINQCGVSSEETATALETAALKISNRSYAEAAEILAGAKAELAALLANVSEQKYHLSEADLSISGNKSSAGEFVLSSAKTSVIIKNEALKTELTDKNYEGYLNFEYWDDTWGNNIYIISGTAREPQNLFNTVAQLKDEGLKQWKTARIKLFKENIKYAAATETDFAFYGNSSLASKIRNISFDFTIFTPDKTSGTSGLWDKNPIRAFYSQGKIFLELGDTRPRDARMFIYALQGQCVYSQQINDSKETVNVEMLKEGIYFLRLQAAGQYFTLKFAR